MIATSITLQRTLLVRMFSTANDIRASQQWYKLLLIPVFYIRIRMLTTADMHSIVNSVIACTSLTPGFFSGLSEGCHVTKSHVYSQVRKNEVR